MSASGRVGSATVAGGYNVPAGSPFTLSNGQDTGWLDTGALGRWVAVEIITNATPNTLAFEQTDDQVTVANLPMIRCDNTSTNGLQVTTNSANGFVYEGYPTCRWIRFRCSAGAGTITFALLFHATPTPRQTQVVDTELPSAVALGDASSNPTVPGVAAYGMVFNASAWSRWRAPNGIGDADSGNFAGMIAQQVYTGGGYDRLRTPNVQKTADAAAAGSTALWQPAAGKKFRLMRLQVLVTESATLAVAGNLTIQLLDSATALGLKWNVTVPAAALTTAGVLFQSSWIDLGNGVLSSTVNNVLNISLGTALATGLCTVNAIGTEE